MENQGNSNNKPLKTVEGLISEMTSGIIKHKWIVTLTVVILVLGLGTGARNLSFSGNYKMFFNENNPELKTYNDLIDKYSDTRNVFIGLEVTDTSLLTPHNLEAIYNLVDTLWQTPYSSRVDAITNFQHVRSEQDNIVISDLIRSFPISTSQALEIRDIALNESQLIDHLITKEGDFTAINITTRIDDNKSNQANEVVEFIRLILDDFEIRHPNFNTYLSGQVALSVAFREASRGDGKTLMPLMILAIFLIAMISTRSFTASLTILLVIILSLISTLGLVGFLGIKLSAISAISPQIIMTIGIADTIHVLIYFLTQYRTGTTKEQAIVSGIRHNIFPLIFTSFTTCVGFLTFNFNESPAFHDLGNIAAIGIIISLLVTIIAVPALLAIFPFSKPKLSKNRGLSYAPRMTSFLYRNRRSIIPASLVIIIVVSLPVQLNSFEDDYINYFDKSIEFKRDSDKISEHLAGIYSLEFSIPSEGHNGIFSSDYLNTLDEFSKWLESNPLITHVTGFDDIIKRLNKAIHNDSIQFYSIPEERAEVAQYVMLYEMSIPYGLDLTSQINMDKSETRLHVKLKNVTNEQILSLTQSSRKWLGHNAPDYMLAEATGAAVMFAHLGERQISGMITSGFIALSLICLIMMIIFKDVKIGLISLIPNILPVVMALGLWGLFIGQVNSAVAMVFGMTLGIIVDDTIHFISNFQKARAQGLDNKASVQYSFEHCGNAIIITSIVLTGGFIILGLSSFAMTSSMGIITGLVIILALLLDFILLPTILLSSNSSK